MARIDPWAQQLKRPAGRRRLVELKAVTLADGTELPEWSLTLRAPDPGEKDLIRDRQLEYAGIYVTGALNEDGKPLKLTTPTLPSRVILASISLFNYAAALEALVVPEEGEEPPSLLEIIGWRDNLEPHWLQIKAAIDALWAGKPAPETPDPNPSGATATGTPSASP